MDIYFYEAFGEEVGELKRRLPPGIRAGFTPYTIQVAGDALPPAGVISIRTQSLIPPAWSGRLAGVISRSAGYDHLLEYRQHIGQKGPALGYLKGYCSRAVVEQALMFMFALLRKLPRQTAQVATFNRDGLTGAEAKGRRALVVGVGAIGKELAGACRALGMEVRGVDIVRREKRVMYVPLKQGVAWADVIFVCLPLTERTRGMIGQKLLAVSKRCPLLINTARGELTPFEDLLCLLETKKIAGLGLDVYPDEARLADDLRALVDGKEVKQLHHLLARDNVICTPHNAFNTAEALQAKCRQTVEALTYFQRHGKFPYQV